MTSAVQWRCRILLGIVLLDLVLGSPIVKRQVVESLSQLQGEGPFGVEGNTPQVQLSEDTFGPNLQERGEREKRLLDLKTLGLKALGVKAAKAVGAKAVAAGAAAIKAKVVKAGAAAKALAVGTIGLKAKAIGAKTLTAIAALGIKTLLFNLLFGKINKLIDYKERLLTALDQMNRVQNEAFHTNFFDIPKVVHPAPIKTAKRKEKRSEKHYDNYSADKTKNAGSDSADHHHRYSDDSGNHYADNAYNDAHNVSVDYIHNDEPDFLPPPKELNVTALHSGGDVVNGSSSIDYEDCNNSSSSSSLPNEMNTNNSVPYDMLWKRHAALRSPLHRDFKHYLQSNNMTVSNETWSTEAVFGDDDEDYESPETPNNSPETLDNDNNTNVSNQTINISSNDIPKRNYKLKRQKSFHNLKQFRKFYPRDPRRDKSIELSKAFRAFKNDPQDKHLDAYKLSKLFSNRAYKHPFDFYIPKKYVPKQPAPTSSEEKEIEQNALPNPLFPHPNFDPPMSPDVNKDAILYHEWVPPTTRKISRSEQKQKAMEIYDKFFQDVRLLMEKVSEYFTR